jgi:cytochrome c oxidase assembly factor CtaG
MAAVDPWQLQADPEWAVAIVIAAVDYAVVVRTFGRRGSPTPTWRRLSFATGLAFWWAVISPGRMRAHSRMLLLFGAFIAAAPVSFALAFTQPAYDFYEHAPKLWGLSPLEDQQIGAVGMAIEQAVILFAACSIAFMQWLDEDEAPRRPVGFPT